jgi:hypothetical protein
MSKKATEFNGKKDKDGIMLYLGADKKWYYSVIAMCHYALGAYENYLKSDNKDFLDIFITHCNWLVDNQKKYKNCKGVWINEYPMKIFKLSGKWSSGLAQALGISCLTRAYLETNKKKYLESALKAANAFYVSVADGGVLHEDKEGNIFFEEYTTEKPSLVLNGNIFAIWSLYDLYNASNDNEIKKMFERSIKSLEKKINRWDTFFWSRYDLWGEHYNISSYFYHNLHVHQLEILYKLTKIEIFKEYSIKWNRRKVNYIASLSSLFIKSSMKIIQKIMR